MFKNIKRYTFDKFGVPKIEANHADVASFKIVEKYILKGKTILVKRDDLVGDNNILPPWGKMTGIDALLEKHINPKYPLIHLAVNGSWSGWALSELCKRRGIKFIYAYAPSKTFHH